MCPIVFGHFTDDARGPPLRNNSAVHFPDGFGDYAWPSPPGRTVQDTGQPPRRSDAGRPLSARCRVGNTPTVGPQHGRQQSSGVDPGRYDRSRPSCPRRSSQHVEDGPGGVHRGVEQGRHQDAALGVVPDPRQRDADRHDHDNDCWQTGRFGRCRRGRTFGMCHPAQGTARVTPAARVGRPPAVTVSRPEAGRAAPVRRCERPSGSAHSPRGSWRGRRRRTCTGS